MEEKGCTGFGLDSSQEMVLRAKEKGVKAEVVDLDRDELPIQGKQFDYVCALEVLEHLYHPVSLLMRLSETSKRGIFSCYNACWWRYRLSILQGRVPTAWDTGEHLWQWSYSDYKKILENGRWIPKRVQIIPGTPIIGHFSRRLAENIARWKPDLFVYGFTFLCQTESEK